jgi:hypothetical protein
MRNSRQSPFCCACATTSRQQLRRHRTQLSRPVHREQLPPRGFGGGEARLCEGHGFCLAGGVVDQAGGVEVGEDVPVDALPGAVFVVERQVEQAEGGFVDAGGVFLGRWLRRMLCLVIPGLVPKGANLSAYSAVSSSGLSRGPISLPGRAEAVGCAMAAYSTLCSR